MANYVGSIIPMIIISTKSVGGRAASIMGQTAPTSAPTPPPTAPPSGFNTGMN